MRVVWRALHRSAVRMRLAGRTGRWRRMGRRRPVRLRGEWTRSASSAETSADSFRTGQFVSDSSVRRSWIEIAQNNLWMTGNVRCCISWRGERFTLLVNMAGILFIISAPSGSGKSTLVAQLRSLVEGLEFSISYTTRRSRGSEENGREYNFTDPATFKRMAENGEFLEWAETSRQRAGCRPSTSPPGTAALGRPPARCRE